MQFFLQEDEKQEWIFLNNINKSIQKNILE